MYKSHLLALAVASTMLLMACDSGPPPVDPEQTKVGVLLVAHGSRSSEWVDMLKTLADQVRESILEKQAVEEVRLAFIEQTRPTIANEMRAFDKEQYDEIIVVPLFIAVESTRTNQYMQYLVGMRSDLGQLKQLQKEGHDVYYPRARVTVTPALNESGVLKKNVLHRVEKLKGGDSGDDMGVILVGYGDQSYGQQMQDTMEGLGRYLKIKSDIDTVGYAFCGELVDYSGTPIVEAINEMLQLEEEVLVVPVLLGVDEMLQVNTIAAAVNAIPTASRIRYEPDAVLPDTEVNEWVEIKVQEAVARVHGAGGDVVGKVIPASAM